MIRALLETLSLGQRVMDAARQILMQERFADHPTAAIIELATEHGGEFEIVVRRRDGVRTLTTSSSK